MIKYSLKCSENHNYEAWFANSGAYDALARAGELRCPVCGTSNVTKALMAPNIPTRQNKQQTAPAMASTASAASTPVDTTQSEAIEVMRKLRNFVKDNSDYVGPRFAEEARKIHYEETETRSIYGEASGEELSELHDDGIGFYPLPVLPEDHN